MSIAELRKIYFFILKYNLQEIISIFPKEIISKIEKIIESGNLSNNEFELSKDQEELLIDTFKKNPEAFNSSTPNVIVRDESCIIEAIKIDLNSLSFLDYFYQIPRNLYEIIVDLAKKNNYTLTPKSPSILKRSFEVALNSINLDSKTADFVEYDYMWYKDSLKLLDVLSKSNYVLSKKSPEFLSTSENICITSLKNDFQSVQYLSSEMKAREPIFKFLLERNYDFSKEELEYPSISILQDEDILEYYQQRVYGLNLFEYHSSQAYEILRMFRNMGISSEATENFRKLILSFVNSTPTISLFNKIWESRAIESWNKYRSNHPEDYENLFIKITSELRVIENFEDIYKSFSFLDIHLTIPESYNALITAMKEYYEIYRQKGPNYLEKIQESTNNISKYIGLYIAKSKESFIKDEINFYKWRTKPFFKVRQDNPLVKRKIIEHRQRKIFECLYLNSDPSVCEFVNDLINKHKNDLPEDQLRIIITAIIRGFKFIDLLADAPKKPKKYDKYEQYLKAKKVVNRLNQGFIKIDSPEAKKCSEIINWDEEQKEYVVMTNILNARELSDCKKYEAFLKLYKDLRTAIAEQTKLIEYDESVSKRILESLSEQLPFTDEFFEFDKEKITLSNLIVPYQSVESDENYSYIFKYEFSPIFYLLNSAFYRSEILENRKYFQTVNNILIESGLAWLLCIEQDHTRQLPKLYQESVLNSRKTMAFINNIPFLLEFASIYNFKESEFEDFIWLNDVSNYMDSLSLAILGPDLLKRLQEDKNYTSDEMRDIIKKACYLVSHMSKKESSTIPYVSGDTSRFHYSIYDSKDNTLLLSGINTESCFKINNTDNDFLFYTALDKNGFVIKITDFSGKFIARASGFRNGNFVYLNQLRTIYDKGNNELANIPSIEVKEIINALKAACQDIISTSNNNPDDLLGIDAVFITQSYILKDYQGQIINKDLIGEQPMDNESEDWQRFINNTQHLRECQKENHFTTDFSNYPILCIASSKDFANNNVTIKKQDVPAIYKRERNNVRCGTINDREVVEAVNKIAGIKAYLNAEEFTTPVLEDDFIIYVGDDWYIVTSSNQIIDLCIISDNELAKKELAIIIESLDDNQQTLKDSAVPHSDKTEQQVQFKKTKKRP